MRPQGATRGRQELRSPRPSGKRPQTNDFDYITASKVTKRFSTEWLLL